MTSLSGVACWPLGFDVMDRDCLNPPADFGKISLTSNKEIPMNARCAVFAESEVVSLIHAKTPKADIARSVPDAIASRIISMVRRAWLRE